MIGVFVDLSFDWRVVGHMVFINQTKYILVLLILLHTRVHHRTPSGWQNTILIILLVLA